MHEITLQEILDRSLQIVEQLAMSQHRFYEMTYKVYGIPRGGISCALALVYASSQLVLTENVEEADIIVDDIIDSGKTANRYKRCNTSAIFIPFYNKADFDNWVIFPWEISDPLGGIDDAIERILQKANVKSNKHRNYAKVIVTTLISDLRKIKE